MNEFKTCDICQAINIDTLVPRLKEIDKDANIVIGCQGFCGIGTTKPFVIVNGIPVIDETEDKVIDKIKEILKK